MVFSDCIHMIYIIEVHMAGRELKLLLKSVVESG